MAPITYAMLQKRAEHNEGIVATLKEVSLHQQDIEKIEALGKLCRELQILYLQNNLISKIENLERLKELRYLNLAVNNISKIEGLERCESLRKLDLTVNFVDQAGLLTVQRLQANSTLHELYLTGNPCQDFPGYRQFVVASLPSLKRLDGVEISASERIAAAQALPAIQEQLHCQLATAGVDVCALLQPSKRCASVEGGGEEEAEEEGEAGSDAGGEAVRAYSAATRLAEHREMAALRQAAQEQQSCTRQDALGSEPRPPLRHGFDPLPSDGRIFQKNEGRWDFSLCESANGGALVLDVCVGRFLNSSLLAVDVQPRLVRCLIKGRLLQLLLPGEVCTSASIAQRSQTSGHLVVTMPLAPTPEEGVSLLRVLPPVQDRRGRKGISDGVAKGGVVSTRIVCDKSNAIEHPQRIEPASSPSTPPPAQPRRLALKGRSSGNDTDVPPLE